MKTIVNDILNRHDFRKNPFFLELPEMRKDVFVATQNQFYFAVVNFTSPLALIASRITTYEKRLALIRNLWEEHGGGNLSHTHGATFDEFLRRLSGGRANVSPGPTVLRFNQTLHDLSLSAPLPRALGAIGMIERMFADISEEIGNQVVRRKWLAPDQMIHYTLHAELDHDHADDFFALLEGHTTAEIEDGLESGARCFLDLYEGILREARHGT